MAGTRPSPVYDPPPGPLLLPGEPSRFVARAPPTPASVSRPPPAQMPTVSSPPSSPAKSPKAKGKNPILVINTEHLVGNRASGDSLLSHRPPPPASSSMVGAALTKETPGFVPPNSGFNQDLGHFSLIGPGPISAIAHQATAQSQCNPQPNSPPTGPPFKSQPNFISGPNPQAQPDLTRPTTLKTLQPTITTQKAHQKRARKRRRPIAVGQAPRPSSGPPPMSHADHTPSGLPGPSSSPCYGPTQSSIDPTSSAQPPNIKAKPTHTSNNPTGAANPIFSAQQAATQPAIFAKGLARPAGPTPGPTSPARPESQPYLSFAQILTRPNGAVPDPPKSDDQLFLQPKSYTFDSAKVPLYFMFVFQVRW